MSRDDIIRMAREAGMLTWLNPPEDVTERFERFAALVAAAERNKVAQWMIDHSYATGHGDTTEDLLDELDWQITESWSKVVVASVEAEREACAAVARQWDADHPASNYGGCIANLIEARGQDAA